MTQMARSKAWYMVETRGLKKIAVLTLGLLEGDKDGCAETLDDPDGEVGGLVDGSDEGPEEGALLTLGLSEGDEEGCAETLTRSR